MRRTYPKSTSFLASLFLLLGVMGSSFAQPPTQAQGYWNEENIRSAKPIGLLLDPVSGQVTSSTSASDTLGADWDLGGVPQYAVGKVFFSIGRSNYVCSGSIVNDGNSNISVVVTAAHCVMDKGRFVTNWAFVPNYDSADPKQFWYAKNLVVRTEVAKQKQFNKTFIEHDWAFAVIPSGTFIKGVTRKNPDTQLDAGGTFTYVESGFNPSDTSTAFGYPAAGQYNDLLLKYAQGFVSNDPNGYTTWGMPSNLTGGASGGPWLSSLDAGQVNSVNSYKYTNDALKMYGPKFNAKTTKTFEAAKSATTGTADIIVTG